MPRFFVKNNQINNDKITIIDEDVKHIKNVLRKQIGDKIEVCNQDTGNSYKCEIEIIAENEIETKIIEEQKNIREKIKVDIYQGLPKSDKMEVILQKAVELGAAGVIPVATRNAVVKLDAKKAEAKIRRWQAIAESAAKQSKRSYIPQVGPVMSLKEAFSYIEEQKFDLRMIPYELEKGMDGTKTVLEALAPGQQVAVFIGPEGGFDEEEIQLALKMGVKPVSLGKRILRTETAGPAILALLMMKLEGAF